MKTLETLDQTEKDKYPSEQVTVDTPERAALPAVNSTDLLAAENARLKHENRSLRECAQHYRELFNEVRSIIAPGDTSKLEVLNAVREAANVFISETPENSK